MASSGVSSYTQGGGPIAQAAMGAFTGGAVAEITGGSFVKGFATGLTVSLLNHAMHSVMHKGVNDAGLTRKEANEAPYLTNNSDEEVYVKPEGDIYDNQGTLMYLDGAAVPVNAGGTFNHGIDGVKTKLYSNAVFKVTDYNKAIVNPDGSVSTFTYGSSWQRFKGFGAQTLIGGWKLKHELPAANFSNLFNASIGNNILVRFRSEYPINHQRPSNY